jgi:hypothetical protein
MSKMVKYGTHITEAGQLIGLDFNAPSKWADLLQAAGFVDVHVRWYNLPVGPWAKHDKNKAIGRFLHANFHEGLEVARLLFTNVLKWEKEDFDVLVAEARNEMNEQKVHLYEPVCFCYAKKPEEPEV